jgi:MFS transporter, DHA1 family, staphyloferrin B biosynthesis exporter
MMMPTIISTLKWRILLIMTANKTSAPINAALLWFGLASIVAVMEMSGPFWPFYLRQLQDYSEQSLVLWSASLTAAPMLTAALTTAFWTQVGDRVGHKWMLLRAVFALAFTQCWIGQVNQVEILLLIRLLQGALAGVIAASMAYGLSVTEKHLQGRTLGGLQSAISAGALVGPIVGGVVAEQWGFGALFTGSAVACLAVMLIWGIGLTSAPPKKTSPEPQLSTSHPAQPLWRTPAAAILGLIVLAQLARMMTQPFLTLYVEQTLAIELSYLGLIYGATGLAMFLAAPIWGPRLDKLPYAKILQQTALVATASAILMLCHLWVKDGIGLLLVRFLWGVGLAAILPALLYLLKDHCNGAGQQVGQGQSMAKWGNFFGYLIGGSVAAALSLRFGFIAVAGIYLILALASYLLALQAKQQPPHRRFDVSNNAIKPLKTKPLN